MFGEKFTNYIKNAAPELYQPDIRIGGKVHSPLNYGRINALIIRNALLSEGNDDIAIFNPPTNSVDPHILIASGLACYKAALGEPGFSEQQLRPGLLVLYHGELLTVEGWEENLDTGKRVILANKDKYQTRSYVSIDKISEITKYAGGRTAPDAAGARTRTPAIQVALRTLLGLAEEQEMQLAECGSIIICLPDPSLIEILRKTTINELPFFELFPSIKWTPGNEERLGRDRKKRKPTFYFVGSLSSADDLLQSEAGRTVHTLICDGSRAARSISLILSMRSDYSLKKTIIFDQVSNIETVPKLKGLSFQVWVWTQNDLDRKFLGETPTTILNIPYPHTFTLESHRELQGCITHFHRLSRADENPSLKEILISVYGLSNKLFQAPLPAGKLGGMQQEINVHLESIVVKAAVLRGQLLSQDALILEQLINLLGQAVSSLSSDTKKYETILKAMRSASAQKTSTIVRRANLIEPLASQIITDTFTNLYNIISSPERMSPEREIIIWTFRPDLHKYAESALRVRKTIFVGYALQVEEFYTLEKQYEQIIAPYISLLARAHVLKIDPLLLDAQHGNSLETLTDKTLEEFMGLEEILLASATLTRPYSQDEAEAGTMVLARQVVFIGGFVAFVEPGHNLKVIESEDESVSQKRVDDLLKGDKVIFLKNERSTIFDELVDYYGHKPEVVATLKTAESWIRALREYQEKNGLSVLQLRDALKDAGLERTESSIENWLKGKVICPSEDNYRPVDVIAEVTEDTFLLQNKERVKKAGSKVHGMHVKIGRNLARRIVRSAAMGEVADDDPILGQKIDKASSYAEIAEVVAVSSDEVGISPKLANRLLGVEDF